jgi:hypothetical protein
MNNNNNNNSSSSSSSSSSGSSSSSSSSSNFNAAQEELHNSTINSIETQRGIDNARKAATKRKRWTDNMKTANPERYEESLAKMRNYKQLTREQRLAQQKQYRSNMSEEQKKHRLTQQKQYRHNRRTEMKAAEIQLANSTNLLNTDGIDLHVLQAPANYRQRILAQDRNYKSRKWTNIEQTWDEDSPCR